MKTKPRIFFNPIEGSAPLAIHWYPGPYGDAKESKEGNGVYWTSPNGELLAVQFDDVNEKNDSQEMTCGSEAKVEIKVNSRKVSFAVNGKQGKVA